MFQHATHKSIVCPRCGPDIRAVRAIRSTDWVIVGGESGPNARPCNVAWIRAIAGQCRKAGVPCFVKQLGANVIITSKRNATLAWDQVWPEYVGWIGTWDPTVYEINGLRDPKGGDPDEWPDDLRVRQWPEVSK